ncbi:helix-turn-helix domain-containing protein [Paraburkholderia denitrificans]|uniref:Helix-turn-helix domain-containing protein n=1 Tax=Paraburkholderia denitrificans TaxID=694025 RepID=A0ABW0JF67_9BURK
MELSSLLGSFMGIGDRLKEERVRLGYTQPDFAALVGASKSSLIRWEAGTKSPDIAHLAEWSTVGLDVLYVATGTRSQPLESTLTKEEEVLLDNYRHSAPEDQAVVRRTASAVAKPGKRSSAA